MDDATEYKIPNRCQYGILDEDNRDPDCSKPAIHRVRWNEQLFYLCQEHIDFLGECEDPEIEQFNQANADDFMGFLMKD